MAVDEALKLVRWLPELAVATADDIARFGPQAARVNTLLDFIPTMSDEATLASDAAGYAANTAAGYAANTAARDAAWRAADDAARSGADDAAMGAAWIAADDAARNAADDAARSAAWRAARYAARDGALGEVVSDLISPENYRILTNPLATGRAIDVLTPRYRNTQFRELIQELAPKRAITKPSDVLNVGRIAQAPDELREIALALMADGTPVAEAYQIARDLLI